MNFDKQIRLYKYMLDEGNILLEDIPKHIKPLLEDNPNEIELLESKKYLKRKEIKQSCYNTIVKGFDTDIKYSELRHYSLDEFSQKNIDDQMIQLQAGEIKNALWHDDSKVMHDLWTFAEFKEFFTQYKMFILSCRLKSDILENKVISATSISELDEILFDNPLSEEEQAQINELVVGMMGEIGV
jgi:hypothetical protein